MHLYTQQIVVGTTVVVISHTGSGDMLGAEVERNLPIPQAVVS